MRVVKFFLKLLSCLFLLIFGVLCLATSLFLMIRNMTSYENVVSYVKNSNIFDYSSQEIVDSQNTTVRQTIEKELLKMDVPVLVTDEVLDSTDINKIISDYIYSYSRYILFSGEKPVFPREDIVGVVERLYVSHENRELSQKQKEEIDAYVTLLGNKVDKTIFDKTELNEIISLNVVKYIVAIFSAEYIVIVLAIVLFILFIIIGLCLGSLKKAVNLCGKIVALDGVLLIILSFLEVRVLIMYFNSQGLIDNLAILLVEQGFQNMLIYGGILMVIGIILIMISAIMFRKERVSKSDELLENVIVEEVEKSKEGNDVSEKLVEPDNKLQEKVIETKEQEPILASNNSDAEENKNQDDNKGEEQPVLTKNDNNDLKDNKKQYVDIKDQTIIVPVEENNISKDKSDREDTRVSQEKKPVEIPLDDYIEINDKKENEDNEKVIKNDIKVSPLREINIDISHPEKGRDIEFNSNSVQDEEDIEML